MKTRRAERAARGAAALLVACLLAGAGLWLAPRVNEAFAVWLRSPGIAAHDIALGGPLAVRPAVDTSGSAAAGTRGAASTTQSAGQAVTLDAGRRFTMIGVSCRPPHGYPALTIVLRTSEDGTLWSRWYSASLEYAAEEGQAARAFVDPVWIGAGRYVQVMAQAADGNLPALQDVKVTAIDTSGGGVADAARHVAVAVAALELVPASEAMTTQPAIVTRAQWGADESWRRSAPSYAPVKLAFVHHTDNGNTYSRSAAPGIMRAIYYYHARTLGWSDIAYNFLIDRFGTIYEGRYGGMTEGVIGAQTLGFNTGSTGVAVIGTFQSVKPPAAALAALTKVLAWKLDVHHINPTAQVAAMCGTSEKYTAGQIVTMPAIAGHRDANYTDCPGNKFYALLPSVRQRVAAEGLPKIYDVSVSSGRISPNGDGAGDEVDLGCVLSASGAWTIRVRDAAGALVREFAGEGTTATARWDGRDEAGACVVDGPYAVVMNASVDGAPAREARSEVIVDTTPPQASDVSVSPASFSPNGDGQADTASVAFTPDEDCLPRLVIRDAKGKAIRTLSVGTRPGAERTTIHWDGQVKSDGALVPAVEGTTTVEVSLRDLAGNAASLQRTVVVDSTLGYLTVQPGTISPDGDGVQDATAVGFTLTRTARVTVQVREGAATLATLFSGELPAGTQTLTWDGMLHDVAAAGGSYTLRLTASGEIGASTLTQTIAVDCEKPQLTAPAAATVKPKATATLRYSVRDAYSPTVKVWAIVFGPAGERLTKLSAGWVKQGTSGTLRWLPPAPGAYTVTFRALDLGGGREAVSPVTSVTAR